MGKMITLSFSEWERIQMQVLLDSKIQDCKLHLGLDHETTLMFEQIRQRFAEAGREGND